MISCLSVGSEFPSEVREIGAVSETNATTHHAAEVLRHGDARPLPWPDDRHWEYEAFETPLNGGELHKYNSLSPLHTADCRGV